MRVDAAFFELFFHSIDSFTLSLESFIRRATFLPYFHCARLSLFQFIFHLYSCLSLFLSLSLFRGNYLINETPDICSGIARELRNRAIQRPSIQISFGEENISFDPVSFPPFCHRIIISVHCLSFKFHRGNFLIFRMRFVSAAGQLAGAWQRLGCGASRGARQCGGARSSGPGEGPKSLPPCVYGRRCTTYHLAVQSSCRPPSRAPSYTPTSDPLRNQQ